MPMGFNRKKIEIEEEINVRWIAEAIDAPGALAYGKTAEEAIDSAAALRDLIHNDRQQYGDCGSFTPED